MRPLTALAATVCTTALLASCSAPTQQELDQLRGSRADSGLSSAAGTGPEESDPQPSTAKKNTANNQTASPNASSATQPRGAVATRDFELGDLKIDKEHSVPIRGTITPGALNNSPLVVLSHLRSFNCEDDSFSYPCPRGVDPVRLDKGMTFAAQSLAKAGYTVVVPDLGPLWAPDDQMQPYDQAQAWMRLMEKIRETLKAANQGKQTPLGEGLKNSTDLNRTGLFMHSRSAIVGNKAAAAWPGTSLVSYGGFYVLPETDEDDFAPAPADVPFLAIDGLSDRDVDRAAASWLPEYVGQERLNPAMSILVPGLGHNYINKTLSDSNFDDRTGEPGRSAAEHQKFLTTVLQQWFDQTLKQEDGPFPLKPGDELPKEVGGLDTRIFALTPKGAESTPSRWVASTNAAPLSGVKADFCRIYDAMNPIQYQDRCPLEQQGVAISRSTNARFNLSETPVVVPVSAESAGSVIIHAMPAGSRTDDQPSTTLKVQVEFTDATLEEVPVPPHNQVFKDRKSQDNNGEYWIETLRLALPKSAQGKAIESVHLTGDGTIYLRAVELY